MLVTLINKFGVETSCSLQSRTSLETTAAVSENSLRLTEEVIL